MLAAFVFLIFGATKLWQTLPAHWLTPLHLLAYTVMVAAPLTWFVRLMLLQQKTGEVSAYKRQARELHQYYIQINEAVTLVCLDNDACKSCVGNECMIGYTKYLIAQIMADDPTKDNAVPPGIKDLERVFDPIKTLRSLTLTVSMMRRNTENFQNPHLHRIRRNLESVLFSRYLQTFSTWDEYGKWLRSLKQPEADELAMSLEIQSPPPPTA